MSTNENKTCFSPDAYVIAFFNPATCGLDDTQHDEHFFQNDERAKEYASDLAEKIKEPVKLTTPTGKTFDF